MASSTVQFGRTAYLEAVSALEEIVNAVKAAKGTVSDRRQLATWEALGSSFDDMSYDDKPFADEIPQPPTDGTLADVATWVVEVNAWAEQVADEVVTKILKAQSPDTGTLDALKAQYAEKRAMVDAMGVLMKAQGIDVSDVTVPALKAGGGGSSGPRPVKTSGMTWYRIIDGEKRPQPDSQDKHSSMAYYYGKKIMGTEERPSVDEFNKWLLDNGVKSVTEPWSVEVDGITYGMEILDK